MISFPARRRRGAGPKEFVRSEIHAAKNKLIIWTAGANATLLALVLAITRLTKPWRHRP